MRWYLCETQNESLCASAVAAVMRFFSGGVTHTFFGTGCDAEAEKKRRNEAKKSKQLDAEAEDIEGIVLDDLSSDTMPIEEAEAILEAAGAQENEE